MRKLLLAAVALAALSGTANAQRPMLPDELTGAWCEVGKTEITRGLYETNYAKAKTSCRADRPTVFTIHPVGFWIRLATVKSAQIMCVPIEIKKVLTEKMWDVTADCGADNNSTPIYRIVYTFTVDENNKLSVMREPK